MNTKVRLKSGHAHSLSGTLKLLGACPACTLNKITKLGPAYNIIIKISKENIKDMLRTFQPQICKNLRTSQPQKKITGPYIKKRV